MNTNNIVKNTLLRTGISVNFRWPAEHVLYTRMGVQGIIKNNPVLSRNFHGGSYHWNGVKYLLAVAFSKNND